MSHQGNHQFLLRQTAPDTRIGDHHVEPVEKDLFASPVGQELFQAGAGQGQGHASRDRLELIVEFNEPTARRMAW